MLRFVLLPYFTPAFPPTRHMPAPLKTFIIYARADEAHKDQLVLHLRPLTNSRLLALRRQGKCTLGQRVQPPGDSRVLERRHRYVGFRIARTFFYLLTF